MKLFIDEVEEGSKEYDITLQSKWLYKVLKKNMKRYSSDVTDVLVIDGVEYEATEELIVVLRWEVKGFAFNVFIAE